VREIKLAAHSEKEYIISGEKTLSYGLKGKKHKKKKQEAKKEAQERSTEQHTTQKQNITTKNNTYRLQRKNISSGKENAHLYTSSTAKKIHYTQLFSKFFSRC
jgi:hypothetical protein